MQPAAEPPLWLANGSANVKALTNSFCNFDYCLKRLDRLGLVISGQSLVRIAILSRGQLLSGKSNASARSFHSLTDSVSITLSPTL